MTSSEAAFHCQRCEASVPKTNVWFCEDEVIALCLICGRLSVCRRRLNTEHSSPVENCAVHLDR